MRERGLSTERRLFAPPTEQWLWVEELRNYHALQPIGFAGYPEDVKSGDVKRGDVKRGDLRRGDVKRRDIKPTDLKMANLSRGSSVGSSVDVCIVLTVFSTASYLNQTLTSLMAQSYRGTYRIVAVDDHSEDGSAAILREWASMHRGIITLISLPFRTSGGTAAPANLAICSCMEMGARWLTFTDGDDLTEKDFIEVIPALPRPTLPLPRPTPRPTPPQGLDMHHDASEVTLNVCLGREFSGARLQFCGRFGSSDHRVASASHSHSIGCAVLHLGRQRHGADAIATGERLNLIVWARSSAFRGAAAFGWLPPDGYPKDREGDGAIDEVCLSKANDDDYEEKVRVVKQL